MEVRPWLAAVCLTTQEFHKRPRDIFHPLLPPATEWFVKQPHWGVVGNPAILHPSAESLEEAKQECLHERSVCAAVLQSGTGFYLLRSMAGIVSRPNSTLYVWTSKGRSLLKCFASS